MISATRTKESVIPCYRANSPVMSFESLQYFGFSSIPYLEIACMCSNSELIAVAGPLYTGNSVIWANVTQLRDFAV